jgi:hypothetical protein
MLFIDHGTSFVLRACLIVSLTIPGTARAATTLPRLGDYLDTAYIRALQKTLSPLAAARENTRAHIPEMVTVQSQGQARRFAASYGWHTGALLFVLQRDGTIHREMAWGPDPAIALRVTGTDDFCLAPPHQAEHCYHYTRRVNAFIATTALAGHYVDRQGEQYRFFPNGQAHFPGLDFTYTLMLDQSADKYDFFAIGNEGRLMAFHRAGAIITLYPVSPSKGPGYGTPDFTQKLAVLREIAPPRLLASK